jgi:hypothetical protein
VRYQQPGKAFVPAPKTPTSKDICYSCWDRKPLMKHNLTDRKSAVGTGPSRPSHPLVGTWEQVDNRFHKTSVVYEIKFVDGKPVVSAWDELDGQLLEVSRVKWNGERLHFTTLYSPTRYKARHVLQFMGRLRASHRVGSANEVWKRRSRTMKKSPAGRVTTR